MKYFKWILPLIFIFMALHKQVIIANRERANKAIDSDYPS